MPLIFSHRGLDIKWRVSKATYCSQTCINSWPNEPDQMRFNFYNEISSTVLYHLFPLMSSHFIITFSTQQTHRPSWLPRMSCPGCALSWCPAVRMRVVQLSLCSGCCPSTHITRYGSLSPECQRERTVLATACINTVTAFCEVCQDALWDLPTFPVPAPNDEVLLLQLHCLYPRRQSVVVSGKLGIP